MALITESVNINHCNMVEERNLLSCHYVSEHVKQGDYILKRKKDARGSHTWEQF